jgi:bis(5'-nucleosyl)-tetraphosphatase (symmetrical)
MNYLVGDIQGCCDALDRLLAKIGFSPSRDHLGVVGDLVNRGPASLETLRRLRGLGNAATCVLGNHDLNLLAVAQGVRQPHRGDTTSDILDAPDRESWLDWLRHRPMAAVDCGWLLVHAGVAPQWTAAEAMQHAGDVEAVLRDRTALADFLPRMYGNAPLRWDDALTGAARLRFVVNALTRTRFVADDGTLDLVTKDGAAGAPDGYRPWFEVPGRATAGTPIAFGHWASLGLVDRPDVLGLDTGCVWGRSLTAVRIDGGRRDFVAVSCAAGCT